MGVLSLRGRPPATYAVQGLLREAPGASWVSHGNAGEGFDKAIVTDNASYEYSFDEFVRHYRELHASRRDGPGSFEAGAARVFQYMRPEYADEQEFSYKSQRYMLIMFYLAEHIEEFDEADFAVVGSEDYGALVGEHLLWAVHHVFTSKSLSELGDGPSVATIKALARERQKDYADS